MPDRLCLFYLYFQAGIGRPTRDVSTCNRAAFVFVHDLFVIIMTACFPCSPYSLPVTGVDFFQFNGFSGLSVTKSPIELTIRAT